MDNLIPLTETRDLRLFRLNAPRQPWRIYLLEGSRPEILAMIQAFYSRKDLKIEEVVREIGESERATPEQRFDALSKETRARLAQLLGIHDVETLERLDTPARDVLDRFLEGLETDLQTHAQTKWDTKAVAFMATYYVGYGHKSIGDCGTCLVIMEGVPLHLPRYVQASRLYSGQERSTRYQDMRSGPLWNPLGTELGQEILDEWARLYTAIKEGMLTRLKAEYPAPDGGDRATHARALEARACDIARGFLPMGGSTSFTWTVNLRQAYDHLRLLRHHPDPLARDLGEDALRLLKARYPSSFSYRENHAANAWTTKALALASDAVCGAQRTRVNVRLSGRDPLVQARMHRLLLERPERAEIIPGLGGIARVEVRGEIDVGSFRDLHRHRACEIPIARIGLIPLIHRWYLDSLTPELRALAEATIELQRTRLLRLEGDPYLLQAYAAMGTLVPFELYGDLGPVVYLLELRAKSDVHPTVRALVHEIADGLLADLTDLPLTIDRTPDRFCPKRGTQTIVHRKTGEAL